jgi:hypothetical protein
VTNTSFQQLKTTLDDACATLRSFTLGKPGCTRKQGEEWMEVISKACANLNDGFGTGLQAQSVKSAVAIARGCIEAAKARMAVLKAKK